MKILLNLLIISLLILLFTGQTINAKEQYNDFVTKNNIRVIGKELKTNEIIALNIFFKGGSTLLNTSNAGIEALTLNVLLEGSKEYPKQKLYEELIPMGTEIINRSNYDYSVISIKCLKKYFEKSLLILASLLKEPLFEEKEITHAKDVMLADIKREIDNPDKYIWQLVNNSLFKDHPYRNYPNGLLNTIPQFKREDLINWHKKMQDTSRILITYAGDLSPDLLKQYLEKSFDFVHNENYTESKTPDYSKQTGINFEHREIPTSHVICKFQCPNMKNDDYPALTLALEIFSQNLKLRVRTNEGLAYSIYSNASIYRTNFASIYFSSPKPEEVLKIVLEEINTLKTELLPDKFIKDNVNLFYTYHFLSQQSNAGLAASMGIHQILSKGYDYDYEIMEKVKKVSASEIKEKANKYLKYFHIGIISPLKDIQNAQIFKEMVNIK